MPMPNRVNILHSVATKFALAAVLSISIVVLPLLVLQNASLSYLAGETLAARAEDRGQLLASALPAPVAYKKYRDINSLFAQFDDRDENSFISYVVVDADGWVVAEHGANTDAALADFARSAVGAETRIVSKQTNLVAFPLIHGTARNVGAFSMRWSADPLADFLASTQMKSLMATGIIGLIAVIATFLAFHGIILRPMSALTKTVEALRQGDFKTEVASAARQDEFGMMGKAVEHLRADLAEAADGAREASFKREAFNNSSAALLLADQTGEIFAVNPAFEELCQNRITQFQNRFSSFDPKNLVGRSLELFDVISSDMLADIGGGDDAAFATTISIDDVRISLKIKSIRDNKDTKIGFVLEWQDVTDVWKSTALINEINATQLRAEFSPEGTLLDENKIFSATIGRPKGMPGHVTLASLMSSDAEDLVAKLKKGRSFIGKMVFRGVDGSDVIVEGSITSVIGTDKKPYRLFLLGRDITEATQATEQAQWERAELSHERAKVVDTLRVAFKRLRDGHLHANLSEPFADRFEELRQDYNNAVGQLCQALGGIASRAETIRNESQDISGTTEVLSRRTEGTAATLEQAASALDDLTAAVRGTAEGAQKADTIVAEARKNAEKSGVVVLKTVTAMDEISISSKKVASIVKVIDDIAFQTNLLALNAGVEAARAGDAGRGFAVVASEVRALAQRSSEAATEINGLIAQSVAQVRIGVDLVGETGKSLQEIATSVHDISTQVSEIAISASQQSLNLEEINSSVTKLDQSTQQNAARLEETTAASDALKREAAALVETIYHFQLTEQVVDFAEPKAIVETAQKPKKGKIERLEPPVKQAIEPMATATGTWTDF
ncbi:methyl-accepting chemotaxis sensory transducer with Pas/Pac sensor [Sulfitobacter marinus]|uniref:Methyl-accepting chemotaxis sensory transducer with Pas/Pac sensor n=1 Tax=Sulfitobacter marinus TaxID=394264 RepID=A0A1I6QYS0_9RHOB|nr:methyl-accepting chemotaxis protein [Sulfitobacter marinus]SFS57596.1 methyl-accepting chemotaxis sensory transducer with Pas/Pac sensor [Sulfitobacter marinus]